MPKLQVVFMGTPAFALTILQELVVSPIAKVIAVYTQPPRRAGRGYELKKSPVHLFAEASNIPVYTPASLKSAEEQEKFINLKADIAVVAAYGLILPRAILDAPRLGCVNVHASLLPRWRGAAPIQRAILAGDPESGVTIMQMEAGLDTGPAYSYARVPITSETTASSLQDTLAHVGAKELVAVLSRLNETSCEPPAPQPEEGVTYAAKLQAEEGRLDWTLSAVALDRAVRALNPWPGAYCFWQGERIKILAAKPSDVLHQAAPGTVLDRELTIACGSGGLCLQKLQKASGKALEATEFLNGYPSLLGSVLT